MTTEPTMFTDDTTGEVPTGLDPSRPCAEDGCESFVPFGATGQRRYCDEHSTRAASERRRRDRRREQAPRLVVDLGAKGSKKADAKERRAAQTAEGAKAFATFVATTLAVSGDQVCAGAISSGADAWAQSVGELSKYQPWLATFFAPVSGDNQLGAWLGFVLASGTMLLPVLAHHGLLPETVGARLGGVYVAATTPPNNVTDQSPIP